MSIGETLATRFEEANAEVIATVETASDAQWKLASPEGWTAGVTLHHIAESYAGLIEMVQGIAAQAKPPAITKEMLDQANAEHAIRAANATPQETVQLLRDSGNAAAAMLRSLSDEEYARTVTMPLNGAEMSAQQAAEAALIGHGLGHLKGIDEAFGRA